MLICALKCNGIKCSILSPLDDKLVAVSFSSYFSSFAGIPFTILKCGY